MKLSGRKSNDPQAYPIAADHFFYKPGMELTFTRDAQQHVTGFTLAVRSNNWSGPGLQRAYLYARPALKHSNACCLMQETTYTTK